MRPLAALCGVLLVRLENGPQRFRRSPVQMVRRKEEERTIFGRFGPKGRIRSLLRRQTGESPAVLSVTRLPHLPVVQAGRFELKVALFASRGSSASVGRASIARGCPPRTSPPPAADLRAEARTHCLVATSALFGTPTEKGKESRKRKKTENET